MKQIQLYNSDKFMLCDDEDFEMLSQIKWCYSSAGYVVKTQPDASQLFAHRLIMNPPDDMLVDHKDRNKLNNQRDNLRFATASQNQINKVKSSNNTSGYKGVYWSNSKQRYIARVGHNGKKVECGQFKCIHDAALAYNKKAVELYGEFAILNEINHGLEQALIEPRLNKSKLIGSISYHKRDRKFRVTYAGKWLGQCKTIEEAEEILLIHQSSLTE